MSSGFFFVLLPLSLWLGLTGRPLEILLLDILVVVFNPSWDIGNTLVDASDVFLLGIGVWMVQRGKISAIRRIPYFGWWLTYGILISLAYLTSPAWQEYLTNAVRVAYQLYRYCWKGIFFYPLGFLLLRDQGRTKLITTVLIAADLIAISVIPAGYAGDRTGGPFGHGNALGGNMVIPFIVALSGIIFPGTKRQQQFAWISTLLIGRTIMFSGSRGAFVACLGGVGMMLMVAYRNGKRARVTKVVGAAMAAGMLLLILMPGILQRPNVQRMLAASKPGEEETFQWRMQERWPYFFHKVVKQPLLGYGTDVDLDLGEDGNTPHNGFLAIAVANGVPALVIVMFFASVAIRDGLAVFRRARDPERRTAGIVLAACVTGLLVHNLVDSIFDQAFAAKLFWMFVACAVMLRQEERAAQRAAQEARATDAGPVLASPEMLTPTRMYS